MSTENKREKSPTFEKFENREEFISESNLALYGILISACAILANLYYMYSGTVKDLAFEQKLTYFEFYDENGDLMLKHVWVSTIKHSSLWLPAICGLLATYLTWLVVYLDSDVPGVHPPSPLSPTRLKRQSGHSFHLNYVFAIMVGILIAGYMYSRGSSIEY